jgi:hypothetical protein
MDDTTILAVLNQVIEVAKLLKLALESDDVAEIALALTQARSQIGHVGFELFKLEKAVVEEALKSKLGGMPDIDFSDN